MNDDYLWDRSGAIDPDIAALEGTLRPLAYDGRPLDLPAASVQPREAWTWRRIVPPLALAAGIVLLVAITLWHFLTRLDPSSAGRIYDRLAVLMPPPASVRRDRVLGGDAVALGTWWERLGLGSLQELRKGLRGWYR